MIGGVELTRKETALLITEIIRLYPTAFGHSEESIEAIVDTWNRVLRGQEYDRVLKGLDKYVQNDSKGYPPSIGQVLQYVPKVTPIVRAPEGWEGL